MCEDYNEHRALQVKAYIPDGRTSSLFAAYLKKKGESWPGRKINIKSTNWIDLNCNPSRGKSVIVENNGPSNVDIKINRKYNPRSFILKSGEQCSESFFSSNKNIENIKVKITEKNNETSLTIIELPVKF